MLGEYTLKVIIAVLSISLLLYLLFVLYGSYNSDQKLNQAEATLNDIVEKMGLAKEGVEQDVVLLEPEGWYIWGIKDKRLIKRRPENCKEGNCLCLCADITVWESFLNVAKLDWIEDELDKCDEMGICRGIEENINSFVYELRKDIQIKYTAEGFIINEK